MYMEKIVQFVGEFSFQGLQIRSVTGVFHRVDLRVQESDYLPADLKKKLENVDNS